MNDSGSFSIIIKGRHLDFNKINDSLGIHATKSLKEGEISSKVIGKNMNDLWVFETKFNNLDELNKTIESVLLKIEKNSRYLQGLSTSTDIVFKCYVQSDYAQINFTLYPYVLEMLGKLKIKLVFSILSWGNVDEAE